MDLPASLGAILCQARERRQVSREAGRYSGWLGTAHARMRNPDPRGTANATVAVSMVGRFAMLAVAAAASIGRFCVSAFHAALVNCFSTDRHRRHCWPSAHADFRRPVTRLATDRLMRGWHWRSSAVLNSLPVYGAQFVMLNFYGKIYPSGLDRSSDASARQYLPIHRFDDVG